MVVLSILKRFQSPKGLNKFPIIIIIIINIISSR